MAVRLLKRAWIGFAILVAIVPWVFVARTIERAQPVESHVRANSVVWAGRVFVSQAKLGRWLRSRGASYTAWLATHPAGAASLAHRPTPIRAARVKHAPGRAAAHAPKATTAARVQPPKRAAAQDATPAAAGRTQYAVGSSGRLKRLLLEVLVLLAVAALLLLALAPDRLVERPEWAWAASVEIRVAAFAVAFSVATGALVVAILS